MEIMYDEMKKSIIDYIVTTEDVPLLEENQIDVEIFGENKPKQETFRFISTDEKNIETLGLYLHENLKYNEKVIFYISNGELFYKEGDNYYFNCYSTKGTIAEFSNFLQEKTFSSNNLILNKTIIDTRVYAFHQHDVECNQWYDKELGLRYSYHLQCVVDVGYRFINLLDKELRTRAIQGLYLHDIVEDARHTYNKLKRLYGADVASDACSLTTNIGGHDREQRAGKWYYDKINEHIVKVFIKFCDRIANMEHGILFETPRMSYVNEMDDFLNYLNKYEDLEPMMKHLRFLKEKILNK